MWREASGEKRREEEEEEVTAAKKPDTITSLIIGLLGKHEAFVTTLEMTCFC